MESLMEKTVNISYDKKNVLEFDIEITGVDETDMEVRFIIEGDGIELGFDSKKISKKTWSVEIPALRILEASQYPYYISVVVDGYAFKGISGSVNILNASNIKSSVPVNTTIAAPTAKKKKVTKKVPAAKSVLKPKRTTKPAPLKVKGTEEMLDALMPKKTPKDERVSGLDDSIVKTIEKAKKEVKRKLTDNKKDVEKKKEVLDDNIGKIIDKAKEEVNKKKKNKKVKKEVAETVNDITIPTEKEVVQEVLLAEDDNKTETFSAKEVASNLIKSVTGMGAKKKAGSPLREAKVKEQAKKVKDILATESKENEKAAAQQKEIGNKKIIRDGKITEVDVSKENKIKDVLKDEGDNRKVTTTPVNKTIH